MLEHARLCVPCLPLQGIRFMDDAHSTDASLLARMAQRDPKALDTFYTRHARAIFLALTMLGEHARATDLTQDVFLLVWRVQGRASPLAPARAWLLRLTRNRAIDELRRDRWRLASASTLPEQSFRALSAPLTLADAAECQAVRDALAALPAEQRDALFLAFFQGLSHQEIASCLRTPLVRLRHAYVELCRRCDSSCRESQAIETYWYIQNCSSYVRQCDRVWKSERYGGLRRI